MWIPHKQVEKLFWIIFNLLIENFLFIRKIKNKNLIGSSHLLQIARYYAEETDLNVNFYRF